MHFSVKKFLNYYKTGSTAYRIDIYVRPISIDDFNNILVQKFKYFGKRDGMSWLTVYSTTDSKTAKQIKIKSGKRGRPKRKIRGKKIDGHVHSIIIGNRTTSAHGTAMDIKESIDKYYKRNGLATKVCKVVTVSDGLHFYNTVNYFLSQADIKRSGGDFNFDQYTNEHNGFN